MPSSRLLMSQTGMCGVMPVPITQSRNLPVPYAVSAASRSGLSPNPLLSPFNHRLRGSHLVISAGWRSLYVDDNRVLDVDQIIEPIAKLDALVSLRGPGRARIHRRDHLCRLAVCVSAFIIEGGKELCDGARLAYRCCALGTGLESTAADSEQFRYALWTARIRGQAKHAVN